jgi:hypothetical protein
MFPKELPDARDPCGRVQPRIEPDGTPFLDLGGDPVGGLVLGNLQNLESVFVDLRTGLERVAAVDEQSCQRFADDGQTGRAGEAGQPF